ncbi:FAD-dependent oxidoreductase [Micromonospora deserti]|uniref:FAD-dependent monooxygenase n=1 Tax=Micromonospora deserti TaxID=2070366 RepID=A0A2W2CV22_9ACTN|nr:NAD(P)/FAD-dependent oxidoreductase [Micromonospora deserti]PZG01731.1 FAD-dependent monooxygenase [Micromonospora deserti]
MPFTTGDLDEALAAVDRDRIRVLIVGAGIAGASAAALLRRQGLHAAVVERADAHARAGYMLALMPLVDPAIAELGLRDRYLAASVGLDRYRAIGRRGRPLREYAMADLMGRYGDYRGIDRAALLDLLGDGPVAYATTVTALRQTASCVQVTLRGGDGQVRETEFDLVIAADGLHSATRDLLLPPSQVTGFDSGWGGWVAWTDADADMDLGEELWGAGFFAGTYPVRGMTGVFVGGDRRDTEAGPARFATVIRGQVPRLDDRMRAALAAISTQRAYFWPLFDRRAASWAIGRVVLLGDAAAGFLPTAGIGAGMAIESAHVLCSCLRHATIDRVPDLLAGYERAQKPRVLAAQNNSRTLARLMFSRSRSLAAVRDTVSRHVSLTTALRPITRLLRTQPATSPAAR